MIHTKLKKYRKSKRIRLKELSDATGITISNISNMENGKAGLTVKNLEKICDAMNLRIEIIDKENE